MHHRKIFELINVGRRKRRSAEEAYSCILRNLDLTVYAGERLGIVGSSGSGKTTLIRLLADLESPDEGQIFFDGKNIANFDPKEYRRLIGYVQQSPSLFDGTVEENLVFGSRLIGKESTTDKLKKLVQQVGLAEELLAAKINTLSVGQAQRVAIARALSVNPSVLLMDEPTSALDTAAARKIVELVKNLALEMELTVVMVLHDLEIAKSCTDRVALLADGKINSIGPSESFFRSPPTELAQRFAAGMEI